MNRTAVVFALAILLPFGATAQQALTGSITGTVLDASEAAVPNAQISARNLNTGLERAATSGELGIYTLSLLPVGDYEVSAKAQGFNDSKAGPVRVGVGQLVTVPIRLTVGALVEQVTVEAAAAAIETTRTSVAASVDSSQISNLGLNGRDFLNFLLLTPGVTRDARTGDLSFGGQRGTLNSLQVDGTDNVNNFFGQALGRTGTGRAPYQFSVDSVEEFQVNSNSYTAEFGRAGGAVINVVTKSGSNEFHGSVFEFYRDRYLNANTWINNRDRRPRPPFHVNQFGGTVGGPVAKNKNFFFFNYDGQRRRLPNVVFLGAQPAPAELAVSPTSAQDFQRLSSLLTPYVLTFDQDVYLVKNDWYLNDKHRLSVRWNAQRFTGEGLESSGPNRTFEHSGVSRVKTDTLTASFSSVLSQNLLNEFRFQWLRDDEPGEAYTLQPETILRSGTVTVLEFGSSAISPRFANIKGLQFADNVTRSAGRHSFKAGADVHRNRIDNLFFGNSRGSFTFNSYRAYFLRQPDSYVQAFAGEGTTGFLTKPNFTELGFYVQDEFRATPQLTLNFGLRYDLALLTRPPAKNPDPQLAAFGVDTNFRENDKNNFAPRFGFAYRPLDSNRLVVRGGYGFYYGRAPQIMLSTAYNQNGIAGISLSFTGSAIPTYPNNFPSRPAGLGAAAVPSIFFFDQSFVLPLVLQGSFGVEYELARNTTVGVSYLNVRGVHLSRTRDINLFPAQPVSVNLPDLGSRTLLRHPGPQGAPFRPMRNFARVNAFESGADSFYNGFTLSFKRRLARRYQVTLAYTFSKAIDTVVDFTNVVPFNPIDEPKHAQYGLYPGLDRGPSVNDQRHRVVTNFVWDLDYFRKRDHPAARYLLDGWQISGIILAQTGQPFSDGVGSDPNNDSNGATDRVPQTGRNTNYAPTIANWDLRVQKSIPIRERLKFQMALDLFNAFNHANFLAGDIRNGRYNYTPATGVFAARTDFGTFARQTLDNRILQISGKIVW